MSYFAAYGRLIAADAKVKLAHRADFAFILLGMIATSLASGAALYLMVGQGGTMAGYSRYELVFMQGFMFCTYAFESSFCNAMYMLETWLKNGNFVRYYLRPVHPIKTLLLERFHPQGLIVLGVGLAFCGFALAHLPDLVDTRFVLAFLLLWPLAALLLTTINLAAISSCFFVGEFFPVFHTVGKITDMSRYPFEVFPKLMRHAFQLLPLAGLVWLPCQVLLRGEPLLPILAGMLLLAAVSLGLLNWQWRAGMRRWAGAGG
ncbi:MAG TPA: ABC-2 family transporter protein [Chitinolyticbacter sp.]|nr:ABC-2 family transporter protein [Chitinolyticbacter sp.]